MSKTNLNLNNVNATTILKYIGIALALFVAYAFGKKIAKLFGITKTPEQKAIEIEEKETVEVNQKAIQDTYQQARSRHQLSRPTAQWKGYADMIFTALDSVIEDEESAGLYLAMPRNDADFWELERQFGVRESTFWGMTVVKGRLQTFIQSQLSNEKRNAVNDNYRRKGITARI